MDTLGQMIHPADKEVASGEAWLRNPERFLSYESFSTASI